jgi:hypothetical protein
MPSHLWSEEWRDEKAGSRYPFADGCTLATRGGEIRLEPAMFVDAAVYPIGGGARLGLTAIEVVGAREVTLRVGMPGGLQLASCSFDPLLPPTTLALADAAGRPAGMLLCDPTALSVAQAWPLGSFPFATGAAEFVASCCVPVPADHVQGFVLEDGTAVSGEVWLVGEEGVVLTADADGRIRVDVTGEPLHARLLCGGQGAFEPPPAIRHVRVTGGPHSSLVAPDAYGNFDMQAGTSLRPDPVLRLASLNGAIVLGAIGGLVKE